MPTFLSTLPMDQLTEAHLQRLISDSVGESRELEFKRDTYGSTRDDKREFLKDVTAFANTIGGHLIIGMDESGGLATEVTPIREHSVDAEKQRLENLLRDAVAPRLMGLQIQHIPVATGGFVLVIQVPRSWNPPHRVLMSDNNFYVRTSKGADPMDVEQLRAVFLGASEIEQRVHRFRQDRIALIRSGQSPAIIRQQSLVTDLAGAVVQSSASASQPRGLAVLHIVPLGVPIRPFEMTEAREHFAQFPPFGSIGTPRYRFNLDGILTLAGQNDDRTVSAYGQLFRDGRFETSRTIITMQGDKLNPSMLRQGIMSSLPAYFEGFAKFGFGGPFIIMLSLVGVKGMPLARQWDDHCYPADREDLLIDPIIIDASRLEGDWQPLLRPLLDAFWNAFGISASPDFNAEGKWATPRQ